MLSKSNLIKIIVSIFILMSYYIIIPNGNKTKWIKKYDYNIKLINVDKSNSPAVFRNDGIGKFYVHPGGKEATKGTFTFQDSMQLNLHFGLHKGAKHGNIKFIVNKNGQFYKEVVVTSGKDSNKSISMYVNQSDSIDVLADKNGNTAYDWGSLSIEKITIIDSIKNNILPFTWILLFLLLFRYGFAYSVIISYTLFLIAMSAEIANFGLYSFSTLVIYSNFFFFSTFLLVFLYQYFSRYKITFLVGIISTMILLITPMAFIMYIHIFEVVVTEDILFAIFQTHQSESLEFISSFIDIKYLVYLVIVILVIVYLHYLQSKAKIVKIDNLLGVFILLSFFTTSILGMKEMRIPNMISESYEKYMEEVHLFIEEKKRRKTNSINFTATKKNNQETYIVVIGESLNKNHMGLYGYFRDTTPHLSKMNKNNNLMLFNNIYSNHTVTTHTLSLALTQANQYNKLKYYNAISIVELLNKADFETHWVTAQKTHGAFQNLISVIASDADSFVPVDMSDARQGLDGVLINKVENILNKPSEKNRVIFVHLQGSHYSYSSRYPQDSYSKYKDNLKPGIFGSKACQNKKINEYDNSVVYNDYVVSSILEKLQKHSGVRGFIYMPDHAEDVIGGKAHNPTLYTDTMTQIPMISWFSKEYITMYTSRYNQLKSNINTLFSNDMFYDTLAGIMDISTDQYNKKFDLSSSLFQLNHKDALVLHGAKMYKRKDNAIYWQDTNTRYLIDNNLSQKVVPQNINSLGMLKDTSNSGFKSYEIDVNYISKMKKFKMGISFNSVGMTLEEYISSADYSKSDSIWINIRNIDKDNYQDVLARLNILNSEFNLKDKSELILSSDNNIIKEFTIQSWDVSYYIKSDKVLPYMQVNEAKNMKVLAIEIAQTLKASDITSIAFNREIYPFIIQYLSDPQLQLDMSYLIYDNKLPLKNNHFVNELYNGGLLENEKIKTIFVHYQSGFQL